ncbi:hypothetical protein F5Y04DRAFT_19052 [Hypomontagnella monticulosa]|nr:hypothetical protein F5Y04DRAFT_19052 [Hypomontagnella monticulosa]
MDYLPHPSNPRYSHPTVPLFCALDFEYRFGSTEYAQFPPTRGFELGSRDSLLGLLKIFEDNARIPSLFAMLQEWLFFGLLSEFFRRDVCAKEFASRPRKWRIKRQASVVTMESLPGLLAVFKKTARSELTRDERFDHYRRMEQIFTWCRYVIEEVDIWCRDHGDESQAAFSLSVTLLGLTLELTMQQTCSDFESLRPVGKWAKANFTMRRLKQDGWCPYTIRALDVFLTPLETYYASMMPHSPLNTHQHENCTTDECVALDVDENTYKQRHLYKNCECEPIVVDLEEVQSILRRGGIPIIETWMDSDEKIQLRPVDSTKRRIYVTISHVWSDGLGNPHSNAIPRCQLLKVQSTATAICEDLNGNIPFWLDTLVVPLEPETRKLAISRMKDTYSRAHKALVLSNDIDMWIKDLSPLEFFMRLFCSAWMRRLWTLQEGVLGQHLTVWMNKSAQSFEDMYAQFERSVNEQPLPIGFPLWRRWQNWRQLGNPRWEDGQGNDASVAKFRVLHAALRFRRTSKKEDEAICVASLLNLDLKNIISVKTGAERMAKLWQAIGEFPTGLLFTLGPRLQEEPFCWAPASMLESGNPLSDNGQRAVLHEDGLHLQSPGWVIHRDGDFIPQHSFHFRDGTEGYYTIYSSKGAVKDEKYDVASTQYAVLLPEPLETLLQRPQVSYVAIKISLQSQKDDDGAVLRGRFEEQVDIVVVPRNEWPERHSQEIADRAKNRNPSRYWEATRCNNDQAWVLR